jgi:hypothetical protein
MHGTTIKNLKIYNYRVHLRHLVVGLSQRQTQVRSQACERGIYGERSGIRIDFFFRVLSFPLPLAVHQCFTLVFHSSITYCIEH